jgi:hypothetical protein
MNGACIARELAGAVRSYLPSREFLGGAFDGSDLMMQYDHVISRLRASWNETVTRSSVSVEARR